MNKKRPRTDPERANTPPASCMHPDLAVHRATVVRDGRGWGVRIQGLHGLGSFHARDLSDVEPRALKVLSGYTGLNPEDVRLELALSFPGRIQDRLQVIDHLATDIGAEYDALTAELTEIGLSLLDITRVVRLHQWLPRPLTVTNAELAECGLEGHPEAVGVEWDDHGFAATRTCRGHLEMNRRSYRDLPPESENALVYEDIDRFECDFCNDDNASAVEAECR